MAYTVTIAPDAIMLDNGESTTFTATGAGAAAEGTESFVWTVDGVPQESVTNTLTFVGLNPSTGPELKIFNIKVVATTTPTGEGLPESAEATTKADVRREVPVPPEPVVPDGELPYVHPLPQRTSAYIWCGWWVMDEIQKMTLEGKSWKTDDPDSEYYLHRYTLQKMLTDYPEVDVQESRNGYIIHKSALDAGIIYFYP